MGANSKIDWTDATFNPWRGCSKVSPACKNCYAMELVNRFGGDFLGKRVVAAESYWRQPIKWNGQSIIHCNTCGADSEPMIHKIADHCISHKTPCGCGSVDLVKRNIRVFCASLADIFEDWSGVLHTSDGQELYQPWHNAQPEFVASVAPCEGDHLTLDDVRARLFRLIGATPNLDWLLLTKRPENIVKMWPTWLKGFPADGSGGHGSGSRYLKNVWLGTTVENQEQADKRIPELVKCRDLSPVLFLSCEPLLSDILLSRCEFDRMDWLIAGGESGSDFRPMKIDWVRSLKDQCEELGTAFFCKQGAGKKSGKQYDLPDDLFYTKEFPR